MVDRELLHLEVGSYWLQMDWATMAPVKVKTHQFTGPYNHIKQNANYSTN
jgi:hypothetical protein